MVREDSGRICFSNDETEEEISLLLHRRQLNSVKSNGLRLSSFMRVPHELPSNENFFQLVCCITQPLGSTHCTAQWSDVLHCSQQYGCQCFVWQGPLHADATACVMKMLHHHPVPKSGHLLPALEVPCISFRDVNLLKVQSQHKKLKFKWTQFTCSLIITFFSKI